MHRTALPPQTKNYLAQNVKRAEVEKCCVKLILEIL